METGSGEVTIYRETPFRRRVEEAFNRVDKRLSELPEGKIVQIKPWTDLAKASLLEQSSLDPHTFRTLMEHRAAYYIQLDRNMTLRAYERALPIVNIVRSEETLKLSKGIRLVGSDDRILDFRSKLRLFQFAEISLSIFKDGNIVMKIIPDDFDSGNKTELYPLHELSIDTFFKDDPIQLEFGIRGSQTLNDLFGAQTNISDHFLNIISNKVREYLQREFDALEISRTQSSENNLWRELSDFVIDEFIPLEVLKDDDSRDQFHLELTSARDLTQVRWESVNKLLKWRNLQAVNSAMGMDKSFYTLGDFLLPEDHVFLQNPYLLEHIPQVVEQFWRNIDEITLRVKKEDARSVLFDDTLILKGIPELFESYAKGIDENANGESLINFFKKELADFYQQVLLSRYERIFSKWL